jgi:hypothetical protein
MVYTVLLETLTLNIFSRLSDEAAEHCKTDESHAPHKFTKMQSGPMTNVISPNSINI